MFNKNSMLFSTEIGNPLRGEIFAWGGGGGGEIPGPPPLSVKPCILNSEDFNSQQSNTI